MPRNLRFAFFTHSVSSDWNNGNAHFLRGLVRALIQMGHQVTCWEEESGWSRTHLLQEENFAGEASIQQFHKTYPELIVRYYTNHPGALERAMDQVDVAVVHEWHTPEIISSLLTAARGAGCTILFHDTHHRASSSPEQIKRLQVEQFDGVLAFGESLREIYKHRFGLSRVWVLHEAADSTVFFPEASPKNTDVVWVGNWGDNERTRELYEFLIEPAALNGDTRWLVHGVRYPPQGLEALRKSGIRYGGYLPNLAAPDLYRRSRVTLHIPRQQYQQAMRGIPTIRVFEALAMGIPLVSAPWQDTEKLFRPDDYVIAHDTHSMAGAIRMLLNDPKAAEQQALRGLETVLSRHTCQHRAEELTSICEELLA